MKSFIKKHWPLLIILLLGFISFGWFSDGLLIAGGDNTIYLNPSLHLKDYFYSWIDIIDAGAPNTIKPLIFPFSVFWYFLSLLNLSLVNIERFWVFLYFVFPGITMYFLIRHLYESDSEKGKIAALLGATLYMFNYLVMVDVIQLAIRPLMAFLPLQMLFLIKGLEEKQISFKGLLQIINNKELINVNYNNRVKGENRKTSIIYRIQIHKLQAMRPSE